VPAREKSRRLDGEKNSGDGRSLSGPAQEKIRMVERLENCKFDRGLFGKLQEKIKAYFEGELVEFGQDVPVVLEGYSEFGRKVLEACRKIKYGQTISYGQLSKMAGRANAARAVGGILGRNRLPLIVPCHRVIRGDGGMGGFSAAGGVEVKKKMLEMERKFGH
jgi:O-6-methylguanine DNA methyltransferase